MFNSNCEGSSRQGQWSIGRDNKHFDCPPKMADGRHFTDYRPSCDIDVAIRNDNSIKNNFQYRKFLQTNGVESPGCFNDFGRLKTNLPESVQKSPWGVLEYL